ncbi:MAG: PUR family DNA/RNA-binding protein [Tannerellaceae bacterium]|nr:PUR family DNA/RNA-binding protein [Tannerellaceae bacterium]
MEESMKKTQGENGDKEILYSKAIKAGKRIYYLDVKKNQKEDLFLAITESKKIQPKDGSPLSFEKHKIFLYKEDFDKFLEGIQDIIGYIRKQNETAAGEAADERRLTLL